MFIKGKFISPPLRLDLGSKGLNFERADIELTGIEQAGPSFEGRVFLNNPHADLKTAPTGENGYAGSFHVYGYGLDPSPQAVAQAPITKNVIATDAVRAAAANGHDVTITVVPVYTGNPPADASEALKVDAAKIVIR